MNNYKEGNDIRVYRSCLILLLLIMALTPSAAAANMMFRANPEHTGVFDNGGFVPSNAELWRFEKKGGVWSSPSVSNGIVYIVMGSEYPMGKENLYAIYAETGTEKWRFTMPQYVFSSPTVANGIVYVGCQDKNLYAIETATGMEKWHFATAGTVDSSPAVSSGIVYVGSEDKNLYAIDAATGMEKWHFVTAGPVKSSPVVSNDVIYVGSMDGNLYAIDAWTGKEKWRFATGNSQALSPMASKDVPVGSLAVGGNGVESSPAVSNGVVYVGSWDKNLYAIYTATGMEKWRFATNGWVRSSPAVLNGIVYVGSGDKNLYAIDEVTGTEKWRFATGNWVESSPAVSDGVVYVGSMDNNLYAIDALTGKEQWRFVTGDKVWSSPAVSNGVVYIGSWDDNLYAIGQVTSTPIITLTSVSTQGVQSTPSNSGDSNWILPIIVILAGLLLAGGGYAIYRMKKVTSVETSLNYAIKYQKNQDLVFISSKSEDFEFTQQVYNFLKDRGYNVFFSQQTLPDMGSSDYRREIDRALDDSKHMIIVTSKKEYVTASWVEAEWGLFINEKRSGRKLGNIITLIIGAMQIEDLPSSLRYYEVIPFDPKTFEKMLKYLK